MYGNVIKYIIYAHGKDLIHFKILLHEYYEKSM